MNSRFPTQEEWEKRCDGKARFDRANKTRKTQTSIAPDGSLAVASDIILANIKAHDDLFEEFCYFRDRRIMQCGL